MNKDDKYTRGKFLTIIGGAVLAIVVTKFSVVEKLTRKSLGGDDVTNNAYDNNTYGGVKKHSLS